jgi:threonine/homoserine/homoserine lactone efflux protein
LNITVIFFLGLIIALVGVVPPGLLNMTAAKVSLKEGYSRGVIFSLGVCFIVFLQTYIAAMFARYLSSHPNTVEILRQVAFVIFVLITIYFLFVAKSNPKPDVESHAKSKPSRFFKCIFF